MRVSSASSPRSASGRGKPWWRCVPCRCVRPATGGHDQGGHAVRAVGPPALGRAATAAAGRGATRGLPSASSANSRTRRRSTTQLLVFGLWLASNTPRARRDHPPGVNLVVSNVGGVEGTRYLGACRLVAAYPVSMLADPTGLNVTVAVGRWPHGLRHRGECRGAGRCIRARAGLRGGIPQLARAVPRTSGRRKRAAPSRT